MDTPSSFQTDSLIAEDIDAYLRQHQHKSPIGDGLPSAQPDHPRDGGVCLAAARAHRRRDAERARMIARILWFAALVVVALVTAVLQVDKQAETSPALAPLVPAPMRNYAQTRITAAALESGDPKAALAEAERLVRRRPLPAEYLTLLAVGQAKTGQEARAAETIQVAAKRGWREPLAQVAMLRLALANADRTEAARRYAALFLRDATPDALLLELGPEVLDGPEAEAEAARDTILAVVVGGDRWHATFLRRGARVMPPAAFAAIAQGSIERGVRFDCKVLKVSVDSLARRDGGAAASLRAAGVKRCPKLGA